MEQKEYFYILDVIMDLDQISNQQFAILSCIDQQGKKAAIRCNFNNYIYFQPQRETPEFIQNLLNLIWKPDQNTYDLAVKNIVHSMTYYDKEEEEMRIIPYKSYEVVEMKKLFGYQQKGQKYIKMHFETHKQYLKALELFKKSNTEEKFNVQMLYLEDINRESKSFFGKSIYNLSKQQLALLLQNLDIESSELLQDLDFNIEYHENYIDDHLKFLNNSEIRVCSWIEVYLDKKIQQQDNPHNTDQYFIYPYSDLRPAPQEFISIIPKLKILCYDIETTTHNEQKFPNPSLYSNKIVQIGCVFINDINDISLIQQGKSDATSIYTKYILTLGPCEEIPGVKVLQYTNELGLLRAFFKLLILENPDITLGYNIFGFDDRYIRVRTDMYRLHDSIINKLEKHIQRIQLQQKTDVYMEFNKDSSNTGQNTYYVFDFKGQIRIDLLHQVRADMKLEKYKLDYVSQKIIRGQLVKQDKNYVVTNTIDGLEKNTYIILSNDDEFDLQITEKIYIEDIQVQQNEQKRQYILYLRNDENLQKSYLPFYKEVDFGYWQLCKDDVSPKQIFDAYKSCNNNNPIEDTFLSIIDNPNEAKHIIQQRTMVAKYCVIDCYLVTVLSIALKTIQRTQQMANISNIPYRNIFWKAQGVKIQSLVYRNCIKKNYILSKSQNEKIKIEGAHVIDAISKRFKYPITVYDFESLYPNSIITNNLSPDTQLTQEQYEELIQQEKYQGKIINVYIDNNDKNREIDDKEMEEMIKNNDEQLQNISMYHFVKKDILLGLFPEILIGLLQERKNVRLYMKNNAKKMTPEEYQVYDSIQLSIKVVANSFYGILGAQGILHCPEIARSTTFFGRKSLHFAKRFMEEELQTCFENPNLVESILTQDKQIYGEIRDVICQINDKYETKIQIIYGDSVTGDTPLMIKNLKGQVEIIQIGQMIRENKWKDYPGFKAEDLTLINKQQAEFTGYIYAFNHWAKIKRVIRHKCNKKIYRVSTMNSIVDVTEDHSILDKQFKIIKPKDILYGHPLLQGFPQNDSLQLEKTNKNAFKLGQNYTPVSHQFCYSSIMNGSFETRYNFMIGFLSQNAHNVYITSDKAEEQQMKQDTKQDTKQYIKQSIKKTYILHHKIGAQFIYFIAKTLGMYPIIQQHGEYHQIKFFYGAYQENLCNTVNVELIHEKYDDYVYDIETESGVFNAGLGELTIKNTDSIFVDLGLNLKENIKKGLEIKDLTNLSIKLGSNISKVIYKKLKDKYDGTLNLQFEKVLNNFFLFSKKHYIGWLHEKDYEHRHLKYAGIVLQRRDNPEIVKHMFRKIFLYTEKHDNDDNFEQNLLDFFIDMVKDVINGKYPIKYFVMSKTLSRSYKNPEQQCHVSLANRLTREKNMTFLSNERIPYVVLYKKMKTNSKSGTLSDVVQHPDFIEKDDQIDYLYYVANQIQKPLFELIIKIYGNNEYNPYFNKLKYEFENICLNIEENRMNELVSEFNYVTTEYDNNGRIEDLIKIHEFLDMCIDYKDKNENFALYNNNRNKMKQQIQEVLYKKSKNKTTCNNVEKLKLYDNFSLIIKDNQIIDQEEFGVLYQLMNDVICNHMDSMMKTLQGCINKNNLNKLQILSANKDIRLIMEFMMKHLKKEEFIYIINEYKVKKEKHNGKQSEMLNETHSETHSEKHKQINDFCNEIICKKYKIPDKMDFLIDLLHYYKEKNLSKIDFKNINNCEQIDDYTKILKEKYKNEEEDDEEKDIQQKTELDNDLFKDDVMI